MVHEDLRPRIPIPLLPTVTKLPFPTADTHGMDGRNIEPRTVLWAVAEVSWEDQGGTSNRTSATLEDTSPSGACIRLKAPITVGSRVTVKWHREQFSAVARNCRIDGREFLLGVRREAAANRTPARPSSIPDLSHSPASAELSGKAPQNLPSRSPVKRQNSQEPNEGKLNSPSAPRATSAITAPCDPAPAKAKPAILSQLSESRRPDPVPRLRSPSQGSSPRQERKGMQPKGLFPKFWRSRQDVTNAPAKAAPTETLVNKSHSPRAEGITGPQTDLLSYEDIYHAAGILSPCSGYGVHKVVEMLNSDRIRELSRDIKRASVLMALDAAGTSPDDLLQDATRRQQALNSYEAGQQKQLEEFEARKAQENARIQEEMERVSAHYAERIKQNHEQVVREKEALRNWQMAKQHESQRISEVIELCAKQPASVPRREASPTRASALAEPAAPDAPQPVRVAKASTAN